MSKGILQLALDGAIPLQLEYRAPNAHVDELDQLGEVGDRHRGVMAPCTLGISELSHIED